MGRWDAAERLIYDLWRNPARQEQLFASNSSSLRRLRRGQDVYSLISEAEGQLLRVLRTQLGESTLEQVRQLSRRYRVNRDQAEAYVELIRNGSLTGRTGSIVGTHDELRTLVKGTPLSFILESDHIVEQRIHRTVRDGLAGHAARSPEYAVRDSVLQRTVERRLGASNLSKIADIRDGLAVLVPANDIVAYRLSRQVQAILSRTAETTQRFISATPWYYIHRGFGSKTARMAQMIPYRLEGAFSYREFLDATRWVACYEFNLPREFEEFIRDDLIESILDALEEDEELARLALRSLPGRPRSISSPRLRPALEQYLNVDAPLRAEHFTGAGGWKQLPPIVGAEALEEVVD